MPKSLWTIGLITLWLVVSPLVKADPFGTAIKYPGIPCLIIAEVQVDGVIASMHDTVGAFVGAELRGKSKVVYSQGKAYVALMVSVGGASNTVTLKVHVAETDVVLSATSGGAASLLAIAAGKVGSGASPALIEASTNSGGTGGDGVPPSTKPVITSVTAGWGGSLNATEANSAGTVTVLTSGAENGQTVTVTLNGKAYNGTVAVDSTVVTVASSDLQGLSDGSSYTLAANVSDAAGNAATEFNGIPFMVDTTAPSITSVTAGWGGSLNATEANSAGTVTVLTSGAENGQTVTVTLNNVPYTGTIAGDSTEVTVGASDLQGMVGGSSYTLAANVSDAAGNAATEVKGIPFMVNTTVASITSVTAGWGTSLNGTEENSDGTVIVIISGAENGQTVTVTLNGKAYNGTVTNGFTVVTVASSDLQGLSDGTSYTLAAYVSDAAGNAATEVKGILFMVDTTVPGITSVTAGWGGSLNATEANSAGTVTVLTSGVENGQTVTVTLNGKAYNGTVAVDSTVVTVAASDLQGLADDSSYTLTANVSDAARNAATEVKGIPFRVDTTVPSITSVTAGWGESLNATEANSAGTVTVLTSGAENGQTVSVTLNDEAYTGTVSDNSASVIVATTGLQTLTDGSNYTLAVNVSDDAAGNAATEVKGIPFRVDTTVPSITSVTAGWGGSLNATEVNSAGTVTVITSGAENGQTVSVMLNDEAYTGTVSDNSASVTVATTGLQTLTDGSSYTVAANVSDAAGNAATEFNGIPFMVDTTAPSITSVTAGWGGSLNATEANSAGTVTVLTSGAENGQAVTVTLNDKAYNGTVAVDSTVVTVAASDLQGMVGGSSYTLAANVSDAAGNVAESVSRTVVVEKTTVAQTLDLKAGWNLISFYVESEDMTPATLFESIKSSLLVVKDTTSVYNPDIPVFLNTLKKIRHGKGYWVEMKEDKFLTIKGSMPKEVTVNLRSGWNLIGYPVREPIAPSEIFKSIINDVEVLKNLFESYNPTLPTFLNTLIQMEVGDGYWVKMKKAAALKFGDSDSGLRTITKTAPNKAADGVPGQIMVYPNVGATVLAEVSIIGEAVTDGSVVGAFVGDELRGEHEVVLADGRSYVAINVNLAEAEKVSFRIWDAESDREYGVTRTMTLEMGETYGTAEEFVKLDGVASSNGSTIRIVGYEREPFGFGFESQMGSSYVVETTDNLKDWGTLKTYNGTGTLIRFEDERDQVFPQIYYRLRVVESRVKN